jgi:hypothetical protein
MDLSLLLRVVEDKDDDEAVVVVVVVVIIIMVYVSFSFLVVELLFCPGGSIFYKPHLDSQERERHFLVGIKVLKGIKSAAVST